MQTFTILCLVATVAFAAPRPEQYTDKFDNVNLDEILANKRLLVPYIKCILDEGRCTPDGNELKLHVKEALEEDCAKCTDVQKKGSTRVLEHLINNEPEYWNQIKAKYDPDNKVSPNYEKEYRHAQ